MEDNLITDFENLKISALSKSKALNNNIHNVTLGPNSTILEETTNIFEQKKKPQKVEKNSTPKKQSIGFVLKRSPAGKMLVEIESQRKDEIQSSMRVRIDKMQGVLRQLDTNSKSEWIRKQQMLIEQSQRQEELILKALAEHDKKASDHRQQLQILYQKQAEERVKRNLELQLKEKQKLFLLQLIESIQKQQHAFRLVYQDIFVCFKESNVLGRTNDPVIFSATHDVSLKLKTIVENMEKVREKCKAGTVVTSDLELAAALVREAIKLKESLQSVLMRKLEEEQKQKSELNRLVINSTPQKDYKISAADFTDSTQTPAATQAIIHTPAATQAIIQTPAATQAIIQIPTPSFPLTSTPSLTPAIQNATAPPPPPINESIPKPKVSKEPLDKSTLSIVDSFVSKSSLKIYSSFQQYLETYKQNFAQLVTDPRLKQFRFHCQKAVNIPLNAISAVSPQHLLDKYQRLSNLLKGKPVEAGGTNVVSAQHPQGIAYCTDLLAKKFVLQGDLLISSNPESAHCYAAMIVALWHEFPDFGKLVLAYFYQTVPYLAPFYPPKIQGQSDQDYYLTLGYNYVDGVIEKQDKFLKRMSGILRLYAAITISRLKRGQHGEHPHGLKHAWRWLASILNLEPQPDITATLLFEFLEITGSAMLKAYGVQFQKILNFLHGVYLPRMLEIDSGGPVCRLEVLLQKIQKTSQIESPRGRLAEGFW